MDITTDNFSEALPGLLEVIEKADFMAFDTEFTGLQQSTSDRPHAMDSYQQRYDKLKRSAEAFMLAQLGICAFIWDDAASQYTTFCWNINMFPRQEDRDPPVCFVVQPSSLQFLANHKFDFNKWVSCGVPFISKQQEEQQAEQAAARTAKHKANAKGDDEVRITRQHDLDLINDLKKQVTGVTAPHNFLTAPLNGFQRRIVYQELAKVFCVLVIKGSDEENKDLKSSGSNSRRLKLFLYASAEEHQAAKEAAEKFRADEILKAQHELVGVRAVIDAVSAARVPVVGHNCLLDLAHIFSKFERQMPAGVNEWTSQLHELFAFVLDTKYILDQHHLCDNTSLGDAFESAGGMRDAEAAPEEGKMAAACPVVEFDESHTRYNDAQYAHEAGYDAFMTGVLFVRALHALKMGRSEMMELRDKKGPLSSFSNQLHLMRLDSPLQLPGPNTGPLRPDMLYVSRVPAAARTFHIASLFQSHVKCDSESSPQRVSIHWLNDNSVLVGFGSASVATDVMTLAGAAGEHEPAEDNFEILKFQNVCVTDYASYVEAQACEESEEQDVKRQRCA